MSASRKNTVLAVLREEIGDKQDGFSERVGCSRSLIQAIELGRRKLTPKLASKISRKTGVSLQWLINGDPSAPIKSRDGTKFDSSHTTKARREQIGQFPELRGKLFALGAYNCLAKVTELANARDAKIPPERPAPSPNFFELKADLDKLLRKWVLKMRDDPDAQDLVQLFFSRGSFEVIEEKELIQAAAEATLCRQALTIIGSEQENSPAWEKLKQLGFSRQDLKNFAKRSSVKVGSFKKEPRAVTWPPAQSSKKPKPRSES